MSSEIDQPTRIEVYKDIRMSIRDKKTVRMIMSQIAEMDLLSAALIERKISLLFFPVYVLAALISLICLVVLLYFEEWSILVLGIIAAIAGKTIYKVVGLTYLVFTPLINKFEDTGSAAVATSIVTLDVLYRSLLHILWFGVIFYYILDQADFDAHFVFYLLWIWVSASWPFRSLYNCTSNSREHFNPAPGPGYIDLLFLDIATITAAFLWYYTDVSLVLLIVSFASVYGLCALVRIPLAYLDPKAYVEEDLVIEFWDTIKNNRVTF